MSSGEPDGPADDRRRSWWTNLKQIVREARADPGARRARRVILILILIWILNFFDLLFTLLAHRIGGFKELNPMVRDLVDSTDGLILYKLATLLAGSTIILAFRRHRVTEVGCWGLAAVYTALAFLWVTYFAMIR